jgi:hypothetical protein
LFSTNPEKKEKNVKTVENVEKSKNKREMKVELKSS